jgi:hypothetical protein
MDVCYHEQYTELVDWLLRNTKAEGLLEETLLKRPETKKHNDRRLPRNKR